MPHKGADYIAKLERAIDEASTLMCEAPLAAHTKTPGDTEAGCDVCEWQNRLQEWHASYIPDEETGL